MLVEALGEFSALGIEFISMTQNIDTTTPSGKLFFYLFAAFAEFERELIAERVRSGIAHRKAKGLPTGRRRDFAAEARICNLKEDGASVRQISRLTGRSRAGVALVLKRAYNQGESQ
jgi:DNA invertase Pin-like site-specific DNA recombinase